MMPRARVETFGTKELIALPKSAMINKYLEKGKAGARSLEAPPCMNDVALVSPKEKDMPRTFLILGGLSGALAVALGAFGAHGLRSVLSADLIATFETGVRYHMYHALALLAVALVASRWPATGLLSAAGWLFVAGTVLFSGSLYLLAFTGARWFGAITPLGGVAFIAGWLCLALVAFRGVTPPVH